MQVGSSPIGSCDSNENPSKMNSCSSCFIMVGVLVRKFVGGEIVILIVVSSSNYKFSRRRQQNILQCNNETLFRSLTCNDTICQCCSNWVCTAETRFRLDRCHVEFPCVVIWLNSRTAGRHSFRPPRCARDRRERDTGALPSYSIPPLGNRHQSLYRRLTTPTMNIFQLKSERKTEVKKSMEN